jgi:hypothetical protein
VGRDLLPRVLGQLAQVEGGQFRFREVFGTWHGRLV